MVFINGIYQIAYQKPTKYYFVNSLPEILPCQFGEIAFSLKASADGILPNAIENLFVKESLYSTCK